MTGARISESTLLCLKTVMYTFGLILFYSVENVQVNQNCKKCNFDVNMALKVSNIHLASSDCVFILTLAHIDMFFLPFGGNESL